jgi:hypothetical protein
MKGAAGQTPPFKLEADEYAEVIFDPEKEALQVATYGIHTIRVVGAASQGEWLASIGLSQVAQAREIIARHSADDEEEQES